MPSRTDRDIGAPLKWMHLHVHTHGSGWAWRVSMHVHLLPVLPQISIAYDAFFDDGEHTQILQNSLLSQFRAIDHSWGVKGSQVREPNAAATSMRTPFVGGHRGACKAPCRGWVPPTCVGSGGECLTMTEQKLFPLLRNGLGYLKSVIEHLRVTTAI
jgi:hypothetical protein